MAKEQKDDFALLIGKKLDAKDKGKSKSDPDMDMDMEEESTGDSELSTMLESAAADVLAAFKSGDVAALSAALSDHHRLTDEETEMGGSEPELDSEMM